MPAPTPTNEESQKVPFILPQGPFNEFATLADADAEIVFKTPGIEVFITSESAFYYWDGSMWIKEVFAGVTTDIKVKVSATDTTAGFLMDKLSIDSTGALVKLNPGGNEVLEITINNSTAIWNADLIQGTPVDASAIGNNKALVFNSVSGHLEYVSVSSTPTGTAGGDLSGTYPNPTVAKIQGVLVDNTGIANFKVLTYNSGSGNIEYQTVVAANVTITPFASITGPDVQSALQQLQTEITHNDAAINVTYNNIVSGLLATNVQDAIDEVDHDLGVVETNVQYKTHNVLYVKKSPGLGEYSSIASAIAAIISPSPTNTWLIEVGPGTYTEPQLTLPVGTTIHGSEIEQTFVQPDAANHHVFVMGNLTGIEFLTIQNAGTGFAGIRVLDVGNYAVTHKTAIVNCDIGMWITADTQDSQFYVEYGEVDGIFTTGVLIDGASAFQNYVELENFYLFPTASPTYGLYIFGPKANAVTYVNDYVGETGAGTAIYLENGADFSTNGIGISDWNYGIRVANVGAPSNINIDSIITNANTTYDLSIEHPTATGSIQGTLDDTKFQLLSVTVGVILLDTDNFDISLTNRINILYPNGTSTDVSTLITEGSTMCVENGGALTNGGGFTVNIASGFGYFSQFPDNDVIQRFDWGNISITLGTNLDVYLYFNNSTILSTSSSRPNGVFNIILGRVVTNGTTIEYISNTPQVANHTSNLIVNVLKDAVGPIYVFGSSVTENVTPLHLDVGGGQYYYGENIFSPSGGAGITFTTIYGQGSGYLAGQTAVDNTQYDVSGTLTPLTAGYYTKHSVYVIGDAVNEKYYFVYGQTQYSSLLAAQQGNISSIPSYFRGSVTLIAGIIVQQGFANIVQVIDERPVVGFKSSGVNASADHLSLLNLNAGDAGHHQFLMLDGSKTMTGTLNMGTNSISNIVNINGIPVSSFIKIDGNAFGGDEFIGLTDNFAFSIRTNNFDRIAISNSGVITISNLSDGSTRVIGATATGALTASVSTTNLSEGSNLYFTNTRAIGAILIGFVAGPNSVVLATDSILQGTEKLQAQISALVTGVSSVSGTTNRITTSPTTGAVIVDIAATYVGQASITTLGTIGTGIWQATIISPTYGGTGINNGIFTITLAGNLTTTGAFNTTLAAQASVVTTLPPVATTLVGQNALGIAQNIPYYADPNQLASTALFQFDAVNQHMFILGNLAGGAVGSSEIELRHTNGTTRGSAKILLETRAISQGNFFIERYNNTYTFQVNQTGTSLPLATATLQSSFSDNNVTPAPIYIFGNPIVNLSGSTVGNYGSRLDTIGFRLDVIANLHTANTAAFAINTAFVISATGVVSAGTWNGSVISPTYGGTGINNGAFTITLAGNLVTTGAFNTVFAQQASVTITLPPVATTLVGKTGTAVANQSAFFNDANQITTSTNYVFIDGGKSIIGASALGNYLAIGATTRNASGTILTLNNGTATCVVEFWDGLGLFFNLGVSSSQFFINSNASANGTSFLIDKNNGGVTIGSNTATPGKFAVTGNTIAASWTTNGIQTSFLTGTFTVSGTAGTRATATIVSVAASTLASTNAVTVTDSATLYIAGAPIQGANMTLTNAWGIWNVGTIRQDGNATFNGKVGIGIAPATNAMLGITASGIANAIIATSATSLSTALFTQTGSAVSTVSIGYTGTGSGPFSTSTSLVVTNNGVSATPNNTAISATSNTTNTGTNIGLIASASGGTINYAIQVTGHIVPSANNSYDLGTAALKFGNIFIAGNSTLGTVTSGVWNGTVIGAIYGGTGQTTYTTGDTLYASATNTLSKLAIGSAGQSYIVKAGIPAWVTKASYQATPTDPATTNSTTGVMMGLSGAITPASSGTIMIIVSGDIDNSTQSDGAQTQIYTGTGAAPTNGAALTGTTRGGLVKILNGNVDAGDVMRFTFTCNAVITGLTVGTAIWVDIGLAAITGGTARIRDISISIIEI